MQDYPEINCPNAYELYHGKGVLFQVRRGREIKIWEGKFRVALNSKYILIDVVVEQTAASVTEDHLPLTQEIVESIQPAPKEVLESCENRIAFVIPNVLVAPRLQ